MRAVSEASKELLPSFLAAQEVARGSSFAFACGKLFRVSRQDGVVNAFSGVVDASLDTSSAQKNRGRVSVLASGLHAARALQPQSFFQTLLWRYMPKNTTRVTQMCCTKASASAAAEETGL